MEESRLPSELLDKASFRGNEYAWPLADVPNVIDAARDLGLANLGGQIQFRIPEGTCELYWLKADSDERRLGEDWAEFVTRSAEQVLQRFTDLVVVTDFVAEGVRDFADLAKLQSKDEALEEFLCFVLYFQMDDK